MFDVVCKSPHLTSFAVLLDVNGALPVSMDCIHLKRIRALYNECRIQTFTIMHIGVGIGPPNRCAYAITHPCCKVKHRMIHYACTQWPHRKAWDDNVCGIGRACTVASPPPQMKKSFLHLCHDNDKTSHTKLLITTQACSIRPNLKAAKI